MTVYGPHRVRGRRKRRVTLERETVETAPDLACMTVSSIALAIWSRTFRRLVGTTTIARCHPAISWVAGIRASAVTNTSNCSRSAEANRSPFSSERHDIWMTVRASWPTKICRSWTGRHSSMRMRNLCRRFNDLVGRQGQNSQYVLSPQAGPRFQNLVKPQPIGQVVEQRCNRYPSAAKTGRSSHHRRIDRYEIRCLHSTFHSAAARLRLTPAI